MSSFSSVVWLTDPACVPEAPNECCRTPGNAPYDDSHPDARPADGIRVRVCLVCGRRHFEATVDPVALGLEGSPTG